MMNDYKSMFECETKKVIEIIDQKMARHMADMVDLDEFEDFQADLAAWTWCKDAMTRMARMDKQIDDIWDYIRKNK